MIDPFDDPFDKRRKPHGHFKPPQTGTFHAAADSFLHPWDGFAIRGNKSSNVRMFLFELATFKLRGKSSKLVFCVRVGMPVKTDLYSIGLECTLLPRECLAL